MVNCFAAIVGRTLLIFHLINTYKLIFLKRRPVRHKSALSPSVLWTKELQPSIYPCRYIAVFVSLWIFHIGTLKFYLITANLN